PCRADAPDTRPTRAGRASATSALLPPAELLLYPLLDLGHLPLGPLDVRVVLGNLAAARPDLVGDGRCQPRTGGPEFLRSHGVLLLSALPPIDPGSVRPPLALPAGKHHRSRRHLPEKRSHLQMGPSRLSQRDNSRPIRLPASPGQGVHALVCLVEMLGPA